MAATPLSRTDTTGSGPVVDAMAAMFLAEVRLLAGIRTCEQASRAVHVVLGVLGEHLPNGYADLLAAELAPGIGWPLHRDRADGPPDLTDFVLAVQQRAAVTPENAACLMQAVFAVLEHTIDPPLLRRIYRALTTTRVPDRTTRHR